MRNFISTIKTKINATKVAVAGSIATLAGIPQAYCLKDANGMIRDTKDIAIIAQTILDNTKDENSKSGDDFWDKSAMALLCACIGYLYEVCPQEQQNLSNVLELLKTDKHEENEQPGTLSDFDEMFETLGEANPISYAYQCYSTYIQTPVKTRNSILISTSIRLQQ